MGELIQRKFERPGDVEMVYSLFSSSSTISPLTLSDFV